MISSSTVVARYLKSFDKDAATLKSHPIQRVVEKAHEEVKKLAAACERELEHMSGHMYNYHGDRSKAAPALARAGKWVERLLGVMHEISPQVATFFTEHLAERGSDVDKRAFDDADDSWGKVSGFYGEIIRAFAQFQSPTPNPNGRSKGDELRNAPISSLARALSGFRDDLSYLTRAPLEKPAEVHPDAPAKEKLLAFLTPQVIAVAKAAAKKLKNDPAACATLGWDVLEDVNAHSACRAIDSLVGHYQKQVESDEAGYEKLRSLVSPIAGGFQWDIVRSAAFAVAIMRIAKCPEASAVLEKIAADYDKDMIFN